VSDETENTGAELQSPEAPPLLDALRILDERAAQMRGRFLNAAILLEGQVDALLLDFFCSEPHQKYWFANTLLGAPILTFSEKTQILQQIVKGAYRPAYDKQLFKDLNTVRELRNDLAHKPLDILGRDFSMSVPAAGIRLHRVKAGVLDPQEITDEHLDAHVWLALSCGQRLTLLRKAMGLPNPLDALVARSEE
jgi:hypothetical protein